MDPENDTTGQLVSQPNMPVYAPSVESSDLPFKVTFTLTRISTGGNPLVKLDVEAKRGQSNSSVIVADPVTPYYTFNSIGFGQVETDQDNYWDNILVTTNVPEPSTVTLLASALGVVAYLRRRLRC